MCGFQSKLEFWMMIGFLCSQGFESFLRAFPSGLESSFFTEGRGSLILDRAVGMMTNSAGKIFVITRFAHVDSFLRAAISIVGLLGLHEGKSVTIHNCSHWVVSHFMNMEEYKVAWLSAEIEGELLRELLGSELESFRIEETLKRGGSGGGRE